jgi:hypothetical protein
MTETEAAKLMLSRKMRQQITNEAMQSTQGVYQDLVSTSLNRVDFDALGGRSDSQYGGSELTCDAADAKDWTVSWLWEQWRSKAHRVTSPFAQQGNQNSSIREARHFSAAGFLLLTSSMPPQISGTQSARWYPRLHVSRREEVHATPSSRGRC